MMEKINDEKLVRNELWRKIKQTAGKFPFVEDVVSMYFCAIDPKTPLSAKLTIFGALAYFIIPTDAIPDLMPVVGYSDDAGIIATALITVNSYVTDEHRKKSKDWFRDDPYILSV